MCGIAGFAGDFPDELLGAMGARIAHRGPDDAGELLLRTHPQAPRVGLTHRRLSIIDLSPAGHQPMSVCCTRCQPPDAPEAERLWLVYNGELYNYRELRAELEARGHRFSSHSDTEVILHLYAEHGTAMLERLEGIFAFALYDGRSHKRADGPSDLRRGEMLLARDGLGVKPLYTAETDRGLLFASELKALLCWPELDRDLDPAAIAHYLTFMWAPAPETPLRGVRKLRPGEALIVRDGRIARRFDFYHLPYDLPVRRESRARSSESIRQHLLSAVERQLVADVPVGAFLSGGLDSSAIVAAMRRLRPQQPIRCYTIAFEGGGGLDGHSPDLPYARRVAEHLGVDLEVIEVGPDMIDELGTLLYHLDEPQGDPAPLNALRIARRARADGVPVLMSGAGGDDIFSGYRRHQALQYEALWSWLPRPARTLLARPGRAVLEGQSPLPGAGAPLMRSLARVAAHADRPADQRLLAHFEWQSPRLRGGLYSAELREALRGRDLDAPLRGSLEAAGRKRGPLDRMLYLEARHFLADHNLNYTDKTSMATGVEVRVPLLDRDLVAYATSLPPEAKLRHGRAKAAFKSAMEPWLPHDIIYRPKTGFGVPLRRWLGQELRPMVDELLSPASLNRRGLFDPRAVQGLLDLDRGGRVDGAYTIFALLCVELWCRIFVDGGGVAP
ncbi:MAG: asparagine synthase (glutamine-hydrolyzing) [Myxococcales bacterium]|nr:asparagine synthase (glutamine-hydrolyzing) [Myxococcales bacterium]